LGKVVQLVHMLNKREQTKVKSKNLNLGVMLYIKYYQIISKKIIQKLKELEQQEVVDMD